MVRLQTGTSSLIRLEGEVVLASAAELKQALLAWLAEGNDLELELADATEVDLTALQLLSAAGRVAAQRGLRIVARESPQLRAAAIDTGFDQMPDFPLP